jgi:hypothetical protein
MPKCLSLLVLVVGIVGARAAAGHEQQVIASGEWSKPVADNRGQALRGRLVLCETVIDPERREVAVCVELQEAGESIGQPLQVYCELSKRDFRPEYKGGLTCKLLDKDKHEFRGEPFAFSGGVPGSLWMTFPKDATIRLRTTPYGIHRPGALAICPHLGAFWIVADDDPDDYWLTATFTVSPADDLKPPGDGPIWRGAIELPPLKIISRGKAAKRS